jgi:lysozyme family protein
MQFLLELLARLLAAIFAPKPKLAPAPPPSPSHPPPQPDGLVALNGDRWKQMHVRATVAKEVDAVAIRLGLYKSRYEDVSRATEVPWFIIAVIHERESSQDWSANLAQGDPWYKVSVHVPKGRGPFKSWNEAAIDALKNCAPYAARWRDWSAGGALTLLEQYNGLGYARRGVPSPYLWAGTDQYEKGKYVADGEYNPNKVDTQLGCAAMLRRMMELDPTISFT